MKHVHFSGFLQKVAPVIIIALLMVNVVTAQTSTSPPLLLTPADGDTSICEGQSLNLQAVLSPTNPIGVDPGSGEGGGKFEDLTDDEFTPVIDIGFDFVFYGQTYSQCVLSTNNYLSFNLGNANGYSGWSITAPAPNAGNTPLNSIMCPWQDINPAVGGVVQYQTIGEAPNRVFVVEYCNIPMFSCTNMEFTDQIKLFETTNIIEIHIKSKPLCTSWNNGNAIEGLCKDGATAHIVPGRNYPEQWEVYNDGYRFLPDSNDVNNYDMFPIPFTPFLMNVTNDSIYWYAEGDDVNPIGQGPNITVVPTTSPTYYVASISSGGDCNGVVYSDTIFVDFNATYYDTISRQICLGESYDFYGRTLFQPGVYDTTITTLGGCDSNIHLTLAVNPLPNVEISAPVTSICEGDTLIINHLNPDAGASYQWYKNGIVEATTNNLSVGTAGSYYLVGISDKGCVDTSNAITITINPPAEAEITGVSRQDVCFEDTVTVSAKAVENSQYHWSPEKVFRADASYFYQNATATVSDWKVPIYLMVMNSFGCRAFDTTLLTAHPCCDVYTPTAFSPNGDGLNDFFMPKLRPYQVISAFTIFDRYGKLVYENNHPQRGWDGNLPSGVPAAQDTYMYMIQYTCTDGQTYTEKGDVTLVR